MLSRWLALAVCGIACTSLTDFDRIVAIEIIGSTAPTVPQGDTLRLRARAIDAAGDSVPGATITWVLLDVDTGQVGFTLDSTTGLVTAQTPGAGRVQARVETLRSGIITVTVTDTGSTAAGRREREQFVATSRRSRPVADGARAGGPP